MADYSQNNLLPTQQKEAHKLLHHPKVAPKICELKAYERRRAESEYEFAVDMLADIYMEIKESSDARPAGKMQAIVGLEMLLDFM